MNNGFEVNLLNKSKFFLFDVRSLLNSAKNKININKNNKN